MEVARMTSCEVHGARLNLKDKQMITIGKHRDCLSKATKIV